MKGENYMSHYAVGVLSETGSEDELEQLLEPFWEELEVEKEVEYTKEEAMQRGKEYLEMCLESHKNRLKSLEEEESKTEDILKDIDTEKSNIKDLEDKLKNNTDEDFYNVIAEDYDEDLIDEDGNLYSTYNKNAKWDWYVVGGRWSGMLRLKERSRKDYAGQLYVDSAQVKDIDFEYIDPEAVKKSSRFWDIVVEGKELIPGEEKPFSYDKDYYIRRYKTKGNFVREQNTFATYALLMEDGRWFEPGQMGWFGVSSATAEDEAQFQEEYLDILNREENQDLWFTVVDCHI